VGSDRAALLRRGFLLPLSYTHGDELRLALPVMGPMGMQMIDHHARV
jgi:hypothetical protein